MKKKLIHYVEKAKGNRFYKNVSWQLVSNVSQALFGGCYLLFLGKKLGATQFGIYSLIVAIVSVVGQVFELRLQDIIARDFFHLDEINSDKLTDESPKLFSYLKIEFFTRAIPVLIIILCVNLIAGPMGLPPEYYEMVYIAAMAFLFSKATNGVGTGLLRVLGRLDLLAYSVIIDWGGKLLITFLLSLYMPLSLRLIFLVSFWTSLVSGLVLITGALREYIKRCDKDFLRSFSSSKMMKDLIHAKRIFISNLLISISGLMSKDLDLTIISSFMTFDKLGYYKMSKSFVQVCWRAVDPFYLSIMPEIQKRWAKREYDGLKKLLKKTSTLLFAFSLLIIVTCFFLVKFVAEPYLGVQYHDISYYTLCMSVWILINSIFIWGHPLAVAINRPEYAVWGEIAGAVIGTLSLYLFLPSLGIYGAAISWSLTLIITSVTVGLSSYKNFEKRIASES